MSRKSKRREGELNTKIWQKWERSKSIAIPFGHMQKPLVGLEFGKSFDPRRCQSPQGTPARRHCLPAAAGESPGGPTLSHSGRRRSSGRWAVCRGQRAVGSARQINSTACQLVVCGPRSYTGPQSAHFRDRKRWLIFLDKTNAAAKYHKWCEHPDGE